VGIRLPKSIVIFDSRFVAFSFLAVAQRVAYPSAAWRRLRPASPAGAAPSVSLISTEAARHRKLPSCRAENLLRLICFFRARRAFPFRF
jgi:hypothetical protein